MLCITFTNKLIIMKNMIEKTNEKNDKDKKKMKAMTQDIKFYYI